MRWLGLFMLSLGSLWAETIETFYGNIDVEESVLIELIHSPAFERLKHLHQYGVSYYNKSHQEEYTRHAHCLGVFALLRTKNASLEEQIAGLLHDVSHTAFSHVGDWVFDKEAQEDDYQTSIHGRYLIDCGIGKILTQHGYTVEQISPERKEFQMLEQPLPTLCADRIDYNIQGAYYKQFLTYEEAQRLFANLIFKSGKWIIEDHDLATKLTLSSLFLTENCWGSALNSVTSRWLADAILQGFKIGLFSKTEFQFGTDQEIWDKLIASEDRVIQDKLQMLLSPEKYYRTVDPSQAEAFLRFKSRGINPWIVHEGNIVTLTSIYPELDAAFQKTKIHSLEGWPVKIAAPVDTATKEQNLTGWFRKFFVTLRHMFSKPKPLMQSTEQSILLKSSSH